MEVVSAALHALLLLSIPFMAGLWWGVEIVKRRKQNALDADAELGRNVNAIFGDMDKTLRFTGAGTTVSRSGTFTRNGMECRITFEAEKQA